MGNGTALSADAGGEGGDKTAVFLPQAMAARATTDAANRASERLGMVLIGAGHGGRRHCAQVACRLQTPLRQGCGLAGLQSRGRSRSIKAPWVQTRLICVLLQLAPFAGRASRLQGDWEREMRNLLKMSSMLVLGLAATACAATSTGGTGGTSTAGDTSTTTNGDNSTNKASVSTTSDSGAKASVDVDKPASKADTEASSNKVGAMNAGSQLVLWMASIGSDGSTKVIEVHVNTDKYPLPATGIPAGEANSDAWVVYTVASVGASGIYTSKGTGTIDITSCPAKSGQAVTGKFNGVLADGGAAVAMGPKTFTLDGSFNLVYFGTDGSVQCKPAEVTKDTGSGSVNVGSLKPPAGSTCDANPCDGGSNTTRNCCPYVPCMEPCMMACTNTMNTCVQGCMSADPMSIGACMMNCATAVVTCDKACLTSCKVSASCNTAATAYYDCENNNMDACSEAENQSKCVMEKCCAELKTAF